MSAEQEYATHIVDLLEGFGHCEARRMFGGYGIFHQGLMFGLIADGSRELFIAGGSSTFSYYRKEREYQLSYYQAPDEFFEGSDACRRRACRRRARIAFDAALRNPPKRKRRMS